MIAAAALPLCRFAAAQRTCEEPVLAPQCDPFALEKTFDAKHAGRIVQLLADVECAATWEVSVVPVVMDQRAWKLC